MVKGIILSVVTDLELTASQNVKIILILILIIGGLINIFRAIRVKVKSRKITRSVIAFILILLSLPVMKRYDIENQLLNHAEFTLGTTLGFCEVFAKGKGIEFNYEVGGVTYQNCNTYHPVLIADIKVPDGKYYVRYSRKYPDKGRIDFKRLVKSN
jgi:hypothetical protein